MIYSYFLPLLLILSFAAYYFGATRARKVAEISGGRNHSLPGYYGLFTAIWCLTPALVLYSIWQVAEASVLTSMIVQGLPADILKLSPAELTLVINDIKNIVAGDIVAGVEDVAVRQAADNYLILQNRYRLIVTLVLLITTLVTTWPAYRKISPTLEARNIVETVVKYFLIVCSALAILTTIGIVLSVLFEAVRFFKIIPITDFIFGLDWSPQTAIREDQAGSSGAFGAIPIFAGTMLIAFIAMMVAIPIGLMSAIYLSEYASQKIRTVAKPLLEILAGIPTVVYGFFAALIIAPAIRDAGAVLGLSVASESALAAGLVMGMMIIPFVSSLSDDVIHAVPQA
ncbi:MAG: phosphate ABC transporter permease family protein, partial [Desulfocapsaceae bacterium]|nr:phosphate ABC transporter permease family protein [Desulfocapsaceae bacterium]